MLLLAKTRLMLPLPRMRRLTPMVASMQTMTSRKVLLVLLLTLVELGKTLILVGKVLLLLLLGKVLPGEGVVYVDGA